MINRDYLKIPALRSNSEKARSRTMEVMYAADLKRYGQSASFNLSKTEGGYEMISNYKDEQKNRVIKPPEDGMHTYVIVISENNKPELRISRGGHYYLANKHSEVYLAGDIEFKNRKIICINDQSGTYNIVNLIQQMGADLQDVSMTIKNVDSDIEKLKHKYRSSIKNLMEEVNLPFEFFVPYDKHAQAQEMPKVKAQNQHIILKEQSYCNQMFGLFTKRNIALGAVTVLTGLVAIKTIS